MASTPGSATRRNDDWAGTSSNGVAVVLDGLTESGDPACRHGTGWFVHHLGTALLTLAGDPDRPLRAALAEAITRVADAHRDTCQPGAPTAPGATVAMLRLRGFHTDRGNQAEYLVLSDAVAVLDTGDEPAVITDRAVQDHAHHLVRRAVTATGQDGGIALAELIAAQQRLRNTPEGYWVAQAAAEAAEHAVTGTVAGVRGALLLSDGAAVMVTDYQAATWRDLLDLAYTSGPQAILTATRELEDTDPTGTVWPRYKIHDDSTAVLCRPLVRFASSDAALGEGCGVWWGQNKCRPPMTGRK